MNKKIKVEKVYRCKHCKKVRRVMTLGDLNIGCADCGYREGFQESKNDGKTWKDYNQSLEAQRLHRFLISGK